MDTLTALFVIDVQHFEEQLHLDILHFYTFI